ncbi:MAG: winged helix-turn-helix domain-containing protein [Chitinophagales bacterium]
MKDFFSHINKAFENKVRLGVMSILMVNDWYDFNGFKELLGLTDGNLASHLAKLEKIEFITVKKEFVGKKTKTSYQATKEGKLAFKNHLQALETLIKGTKK